MKKYVLGGLIGIGVLIGGLYCYQTGQFNVLFGGFEMNKGVVNGDLITVDYVGRLPEGKVFDTSIESVAQEAGLYNPARDYTQGLSFTVGAGQMIKGFDAGVVGMKVGETKTVEIPADEAYGPRQEDMIVRIPLADAGDISNLQVGSSVVLANVYPAKVVEITESEIVFDANHELAGQDLIFDITLKSIDTNK